MIELEYQLKTYLLNFPIKMSKNSYQLMYNLLEKPTILEKDTIINTTQLERVYQHIPRHIYHFGRYLRIRYDSQPPDPTTKTDNTNDKNFDENMEKTPGTKTHHQIPETTPIPTINDTPIITATQLVPETTDTTPQPTENTQTDNDTQTETH